MSTPTSPIGQLSGPVVLTGVVPGYAVIPSPTPLTFLNYYDGKFLQASDLRQEQLAMQSMIELSNQAAGTPGPSYGFDVTLGSGDTLTLGPGLGIDPQGRVLYLPQSVDVAVSDLLASMQVPGSVGHRVRRGLRRRGQRDVRRIPAVRPRRPRRPRPRRYRAPTCTWSRCRPPKGSAAPTRCSGGCATPPASPPPTGHGGSRGSCSAWCR